MGLLDGRTALITGASRGIGASIAERLAAQGAHLACTYLSSEEKANQVAEHLRSYGGKVMMYKSNAARFDESASLIEKVMNDFGGLDILINNAGITRDNLLLRMSEAQWDEVMETNLKSIFNLTKHALKPLLKSKHGSIINISSVVGVFGNAGQTNYSASKAGIIGFSKSIAKEIGSRNVRCNVIAPGFIATDMTDALDEKTRDEFLSGIPLKRWGQGHEVADTCVFLASDMSAYITGQVISVCGGLSM